ncbi:MAG TPA: hypothetical protein VIZ17_19830 [Acetobacteraceae bacterium]
MDRTSDFVRLDDVVDPDRPSVRADEVYSAGSVSRHSSLFVVLVCFAGLASLAVFQPHAHNVHANAPAISAMHH